MEISFQLFVDANKDTFVLMFENLLAKTQQAVVQSFIQNGSKKKVLDPVLNFSQCQHSNQQ